jgi:hypothetical protein
MLIPASPSRDAAKKYVPKPRDITSRKKTDAPAQSAVLRRLWEHQSVASLGDR